MWVACVCRCGEGERAGEGGRAGGCAASSRPGTSRENRQKIISVSVCVCPGVDGWVGGWVVYARKMGVCARAQALTHTQVRARGADTGLAMHVGP